MLRVWRNPEFVRHLRAELRPARAGTVAALALVICALVGLSVWGLERENVREFFRLYYLWLFGIQYSLLGIWCASTCGQAISRERELKTYDFLKTTRLTAAELLVGKLFGAPIVGYFAVACSMPLTLVLGFLGGYRAKVLILTYVLLVVFAAFFSLMGLLGSMLIEKSAAGAIGLLGIIVTTSFGFMFGLSPFPGFGALSIFPALLTMYGADVELARAKPTLFGFTTSFWLLTVLLYAAFGAWFGLMLKRNLKRDREQIRLLSRWQAVGFAAFLNLLLYALLDPNRVSSAYDYRLISPKDVSALVLGLNAMILFVIGAAMLTPHEKLKVWWRRRAAGQESYFSESGLGWPWLIPAALIAYAFLAAEAAGLRGAVPLGEWGLGYTAVRLLVYLVFIIRDTSFLQWCNLTRMKNPVVKGVLYLLLYYSAAGIIVGVVSIVSDARSSFLLGLLTPLGVYDPAGIRPSQSPGMYAGLALQLGLIAFLLYAMNARLRRPAIVPVISEG